MRHMKRSVASVFVVLLCSAVETRADDVLGTGLHELLTRTGLLSGVSAEELLASESFSLTEVALSRP